MSWFSDVIDVIASFGDSPSSRGASNSPGSPGPIVADQNESTYGWGDLAKDAFTVVSPLIVSAVSRPGKVKYPEIPDSVKNDPRMQQLMGSYGFPDKFPVFKEPSLFQQNFPAMFQLATQTIINRTADGKVSPVDPSSPTGRTLDGKTIDPITGNTEANTTDGILNISFTDFIANNPDGSPELEKQTHALSPSTSARLEEKYGALIDDAAAKHEIDPVLLRSMIVAESSGDPNAISNKGAIGLGQLMPTTAVELAGRRMTRAEIADPATNLNLTAKYIAQLNKEFDGNYDKMISAYNAGPEAVRKGRAQNYEETRKYAKQVRRNYLAYTQAARRTQMPTIDDINGMPDTAMSSVQPAPQFPQSPGAPPLPGAVI